MFVRFLLHSFHCSPLKFRRSRMLRSCHFPVSIQSRSLWCLRVFSHCTVLNFYRTLCMPDRTCAAKHVQHRCQWKFATLPVDRTRVILRLEIHFHFYLWLHHGFLRFDICVFFHIIKDNDYKTFTMCNKILTVNGTHSVCTVHTWLCAAVLAVPKSVFDFFHSVK